MMFVPPRPNSIVRWLDGSPGPAAHLGGKGAGLNRLRGLGAPVPLAAAIPTPVYRAFAHANGIPLTLGNAGSADLSALRETILRAPLPEWLAVALLEAGQAFPARSGRAHGGVAVRSSATAEDSADHAFAGLHDSFLNIDPACGLELAIRQCWASLWSDRAVTYRREQGLQHAPLEMAVVIQEMVFSDVSFVGFAVDPISGDSDTVLITATWGLCEAVVAGLVVPDEIRVDRNGEMADYRVGTKHEMVIPSDNGVRTVPVPRLLQQQPAITPATAREIATMIRDLSSGLGYPADIEGGIRNGILQVFQARPITTLSPSNLLVHAFHQETSHHVDSGHHSAG